MNTNKFNAKKLADDILAKRTKEDLTFRAIEKTTRGKVSRAVLQKTEGKHTTPSVDSLVAICNWLGKSVQNYFC